MAFIEKRTARIGDTVILTREVEMINGYFERGTVMKIVDSGDRGFDLEDEEGNRMIETRSLGDFFNIEK